MKTNTRPEPLRLGVLGSGRGSNFVAIYEAIQSGDLHAEVRVVISDVTAAMILDHARSRGVPAHFVEPGKFRTRMEDAAEAEVVRLLSEAGVELVVLAGYMRMVKPTLLEPYRGRIINIHPSLLPAFPGLEAWKQALAAKVPVTGCTVHWVDSGMDTGPIIAQSEVPVLEGDSPESLHSRIQLAEHRLYPEAVRRIIPVLQNGTVG